MLKSLTINNFRCYDKSAITFNNGTSILVGRNNAGKSTLIEALKIISSVTRKYKALRFIAPPEWVRKEVSYGVSPNVENMNISDRGIFNMYGNPPAIIDAIFGNGTRVKAYVGEGLSIFAVLYDENGRPVRNNREAKCVDIPIIEVLPQISAVLDNEKVIRKETVDSNRATRLASRNFRNQLFYYNSAYPVFKALVEATWEGLMVNPVESVFVDGGRLLQFFVRINGFEAEIGWMGHGLQMWIQTMWFISQCPNNAIVVLDEPDVYMHADLQRRLVRLIKPMFSQLVIATHSIEIIEEVSSDCIVPVDSRQAEIKPLLDHSILQKIKETVGDSHNIDLARFFISKRFIIWEGDDADRNILSAFQSILFPRDLYPISTSPKAFLENWTEWQKAITISKLLSKTEIQCYCIMDSAYHAGGQLYKLKTDAEEKHVNLHVWNRYEIENYAINPDVIFRFLSTNHRKGTPEKAIIESKIFEIAESLKEGVINALASELLERSDKSIDFRAAVKEAQLQIVQRWQSPLDVIPGNQLFKKLSTWTMEQFGVSISAIQIISFFRDYEIPAEIKKVISSIVEGDRFEIS